MRPLQLTKLKQEIARLRAEQSKFTGANLSPLTISGYRYDWRMFTKWCNSMRLSHLPAAPETVALYMTSLLSDGKKVVTARRRTCGIVYHHRLAGFQSPVTEEVRDLLVGAQRMRGEKPRQMRPLTVKQLGDISTILYREGSEESMRDRALLVVGWASALRRSNIAALRMEDVELVREGLIIAVEREKNDQEGEGRLIGIPRGKKKHTCPVRCLADWVAMRGAGPGPLFPRLNAKRRGEPMDGGCVFRVVRKAVGRIGLNPDDRWGGHSLRSGFITAAGEGGAGELLIAAQSGHKNMQVLRRYFRRSELFRANACTMVGL